MKNKVVRIMLCVSMAAMLGISVPWGAMAAQTESVGTDAGEEKKQEEEQDLGEERVPEDVTVSLLTGEVVLKNETSRFLGSAEYQKAESRVVENAQVTSQGGEQLAQTWNLVLTEEEGTAHIFKDVRADKWAEPRITEQLGMLYIEYLDEENQKQSAPEDIEEKTLEAPVTVYATTEVNIRETPDVASQSLKVTKSGEEWSAVAVLPGWVKVEGNGITGYVHHEYLTEEKDALGEAAVQNTAGKADQPAVQQNQPAYQEPQNDYQEPAYDPPEPQTPVDPEPQEPSAPEPQEPSAPEEQEPSEPDNSGDITVISREDFPNESGDGHGMYEITYSDGSVVYQDY